VIGSSSNASFPRRTTSEHNKSDTCFFNRDLLEQEQKANATIEINNKNFVFMA